ncbi:MAG: sigma-70 family RNA polymerase sigma factor [Planctomycetota bacterium]
MIRILEVVTAPTDPMATNETLASYDRFIRSIARSLITDAHAVDDVVQQTYVAALQKPPDATNRFRAWIATVARNFARAANRKQQLHDRHERKSAKSELLPSAAEMAQIEETRHRLAQALIQLPETYRSVLWFRYYDNLPPRAIAKKLDISVETVRTRLKRGIMILRQQLDREYGSRREWSLAVVPLATSGMLSSGGGSILTNASILMITKTKVWAAAAALLVLSIAFWALWGFGENETKDSANVALQKTNDPVLVTNVPSQPETIARTEASSRPETDPSIDNAGVASKPAAGEEKGSIVVRVIWGDDNTPAVGITARVIGAHRSNRYFLAPMVVTDSDGSFRADNLPVGNTWIRFDRWLGKSIKVKSAEVTEITLTIPKGFNVEGTVRNSSGHPVAGADVILDEQGESEVAITKTDSEGKYKIRSVSIGMIYYIGARADGYAPCKHVQLYSRETTPLTFNFVLPGPGGGVSGRAVDYNNKPVANVRISVMPGDPALPENLALVNRSDYGLQVVNTDKDGNYSIRGLLPGPYHIWARVNGLSIFRNQFQALASGDANINIQFERSSTILGTVRTPDGAPAADIVVTNTSFAGSDTPDRIETKTDADGKYELHGAPAGKIRIFAGDTKLGKASVELIATPGAELRWDPILSLGMSIIGRVVDPDGNPAAGFTVYASKTDTKGLPSSEMAGTDANGKFTIQKLENAEYLIQVSGHEGESFNIAEVPGVKPGGAELLVTLPYKKGDCYITGSVISEDETPAGGVDLQTSRVGARGAYWTHANPKTGTFKLGPFPPGRYRLTLRPNNYPEISIPMHELKSGETWEVGIIKLQKPGGLRVLFVMEKDVSRPVFWLTDLDGWHTSNPAEILSDSSGQYAKFRDPIAVGTYQLTAMGTGGALETIPVAIQPGQETTVSVVIRPGIMKTLEFGLSKPPENLSRLQLFLTLKLKSGGPVGKFILNTFDKSPKFSFNRYLAPGDYQYEAVFEGLKASGEFTVSNADNSTVEALLK